MESYTTYKGFPVGAEIIPKNGWQKEMYDRGQRFFEPISPAARELPAETMPERTLDSSQQGGRVAVANALEVIESAQIV